MKTVFDPEKKLYTLSILVRDIPGVLSQVARLFSRKGYNIESIVSAETDKPGVTRITIVILGDELMVNQIADQCRKLIPVLAVKILGEDTSLQREFSLIKVHAADRNTRDEVIQMANIFRANIKNGTELGKKAKTYMDQGALVPDELTCDLVMDRIQQEDCKNGFVLDGFPRTIPQAEALDAALTKIGQTMDYAIDVDVPDENIVNRMSGRRACLNCGATYHIVFNPTKVEGKCDACGNDTVLRDDDKPETVQKRLSVYHEQTQPLIDYYKKQNILKSVDGTLPMDDVFAAIVDILGE